MNPDIHSIAAKAYAFCLHNGMGGCSNENKACLVTETIGKVQVYLGEGDCHMPDMIKYGVLLYNGQVLCGMEKRAIRSVGTGYCVGGSSDTDVEDHMKIISIIRNNDSLHLMNAAGN